MSVYAVIHTGGKQYRVVPGDVIKVEKLDGEPGKTVEISRVLLLAVDGQVTAGNPVLQGARVVAKVADQGRGEKIIVFKKKKRKGYQKTIGHRQYFTSLRITQIVHNGAVYEEQEKKPDPRDAAPAVTKPAPTKARKAEPKKTKPPKTVVLPPPGKKEAPLSAAPQKTDRNALQEDQREEIAQSRDPSAGASLEPAPGKKTEAAPEIVQDAAPKKTAQPKPEIPAAPESIVPPPVETPPSLVERAEELSPQLRKRWGLYAAIAGALALLLLLLLLWRSGPGPITPQGPQTEKLSDDASPGKKGAGAPEAKKPQVRDSRIKETAPVGKPSAPARPPD